VGKPKALNTCLNEAMAGVGSPDERGAAQLVFDLISYGGTPLEGAAGNGAAGAALDVSALAGRNVLISTEGITRFHVNVAPTATGWWFSLPAGPSQKARLPDGALTLTAWGVGAAHRFVVVPLDQET
jgi:hypothetical protein